MLVRKQSLSLRDSLKRGSRDSLVLGLTGSVLIGLVALGGCGSSDKPGNGGPDAMGGPDGAPGDDGGGIDATPPGDGGPIDAAPVVDIRINEVVTSPQHDWGHSTSPGDGAEPFDGSKGIGRISSADQYIELYNAGTTIVDLQGWSIDMVDSGADTAVLSATDANIRVSPGSSLGALKPGAFVLVGNPVGTMGDDVYIVLKDTQGAIIDDVEIGGVGRDAEGDGAEDGAPSPSENGFARGAFDESIARPAGAADTNVDQLDFVKMYATPLAANVPPAPPNETVAPTIAVPPASSSFPVTQLIAIGFDEAISAASVAGNVTLSTPGGNIDIAMTTFAQSDKVLVLSTIGVLPFDTNITITVQGGAGGVTDLAGNALAADAQFTIRTESAPANSTTVLLNELCIKAQRDWSNDAGGDGIPFSAAPGAGDVSSSDEWIELLVRQNNLDLSGYVIEVFNGPSLSNLPLSVTPLADADFVRFFGTGTALSSLQNGDRVVIGNPTDSIDNSAFVALRDGSGKLVDMVEVGGNSVEEDRGGDGIENGAPGAGLDGDSNQLADEVIARVPDGTDSGDDAGDWSHAQASLGAANPSTGID